MVYLAVIGASGMVGAHLMEETSRRGMEVFGTFHTRDPGDERCVRMDMTDEGEVRGYLERTGPDGVILTAAISDVDECERGPGEAWRVNVEGTLNLAMVCSDLQLPLLLVSSDYVFNGLKGAPYQETDAIDPLSIYGRTKVEGERVVLDASPDNKVARVSVVYGPLSPNRDNLVQKVLRLLALGKKVDLFHDQWNSPTYAPFSAGLMIDLLLKEVGTLSMFRGPEDRIYHLSGRECVSRYQLGLTVAEVFDQDPGLLRPVSIGDSAQIAPRPRRVCLDVAKVEAELNIRIPPLRASLERMRKELET